MSYQALARKWRPRTFAEVVGQEHVVSALANGLDHDRVHHAFLLAGTRGVGKTTLARVLAKALNCEQGIGSQPCNACDACRAIDEGRFVDLIEVDAASRTKVDDTRELLDNVQYAPTRARYKVYLIDEVHMLSSHSFNALLKTLEEPPPHVKFVLATTDPQKLPVTVLSRCLQFNLKALDIEQISGQLAHILEAEGHRFEAPGIEILARAADGSMRDALSLLDQAIAYAGGEVTAAAVREMLGLIETTYVRDLIEGLAAADGDALLEQVGHIAERAHDFANVLDELLLQLHCLSLRQVAPKALAAKGVEQPWHAELAARLAAEDLQLYYQIGLIGKRDLGLAPDPRTGFEMVLLRMLAFQPARQQTQHTVQPPAPVATATPSSIESQSVPPRAVASTETAAKRAPARTSKSVEPTASQASPRWADLVNGLTVTGVTRELAMNVALGDEGDEGDGTMDLLLDPSHEHLLTQERSEALSAAVSDKLGRPVTIKFKLARHTDQTPAQRQQSEAAGRQRQAEDDFTNDNDTRAIMERFGATIVPNSIRPREER